MLKKSVERRVPSRCHSTAPAVPKGVDLHGRTLIVTSSASGKGTETTAIQPPRRPRCGRYSARLAGSFTRLNMPGVCPVTRLNTLLNAASDEYPALWAISDIGAWDVRRSVEAQ